MTPALTTKTIGIGIVVLVLIAIGAQFLLGSSKAEAPRVETPKTKEFVLKVQGKKVVEGNATITVQQGDSIVIKVTSDEAEEFHVHGYDTSVELEPNTEATLSFVADASGRYPFELENSKTDLGALEVLPQ